VQWQIQFLPGLFEAVDLIFYEVFLNILLNKQFLLLLVSLHGFYHLELPDDLLFGVLHQHVDVLTVVHVEAIHGLLLLLHLPIAVIARLLRSQFIVPAGEEGIAVVTVIVVLIDHFFGDGVEG
jgi:hypothetical protein